MIEIGTPRIRQVNNTKRLISTISFDGNKRDLYYEVESEWGEYLCTKFSDPFLLILLEYAMHTRHEIRCEAPVTERLYYQLVNYYIPILAQNIRPYHRIDIDCPISNEILGGEAVGTGMSGGVDSFYTVIKHLNCREKSFRLTHLLFADVGSVSFNSINVQEQFANLSLCFKKIANELGLSFVGVKTNIVEIWNTVGKTKFSVIIPQSLKTGSCVFALRGLFGKYYFSSTFTLDKFSFSPKDPAYYDLFNLPCISVDNLLFYSAGVENGRIKKLEYIAANAVVQNNLRVDANEYDRAGFINCGDCFKCVRTMCELYVINKLHDFNNVFDVNRFQKRKVTYFAKFFGRRGEWISGFANEVIIAAKQNRVVIPKSSYIIGFLFCRPFYYLFYNDSLRKIFYNNKLIKMLYYKLKIDVLIHGEAAIRKRSEL